MWNDKTNNTCYFTEQQKLSPKTNSQRYTIFNDNYLPEQTADIFKPVVRNCQFILSKVLVYWKWNLV